MARSGTAREALLDAVVGLLVTQDIAAFSLRSLAADLGTSHQLLMYHFGNRETLLRDALDRIRQTVVDDLDRYLARRPDRRQPSSIWRHLSKPGPGRLRVQYQCLGLALVNPDEYGDLAVEILQSWTEVATRLFADAGLDRRGGEVAATLLVATLRGLGLDLMATNDRARVNRAAAQLDRVYDLLVTG